MLLQKRGAERLETPLATGEKAGKVQLRKFLHTLLISHFLLVPSACVVSVAISLPVHDSSVLNVVFKDHLVDTKHFTQPDNEPMPPCEVVVKF